MRSDKDRRSTCPDLVGDLVGKIPAMAETSRRILRLSCKDGLEFTPTRSGRRSALYSWEALRSKAKEF